MWTGPSIAHETSVAQLADCWLTHLRAESGLEATTINEYERVLRKLVVPELGDLRLSELTADGMDVYLDGLRELSVSRRRKAKVVTGAMLDLAVGLGALETNPVRGTANVVRPRTKARRLTRDEVDSVRATVRAWRATERPGPKATSDVGDIVDLMLATGARIGEVLALRWTDVHLDSVPPTVILGGTIKTEPGKGTHRKAIERARTVTLPEFAVAMLRRRRLEDRDDRLDAVFPTRNGTWQQVNNVERRWRQIRKAAGLEWVTPDAFRNILGEHLEPG
jgi:integrase